ncbi:hypothetical protein ACU4GR_28435 [Methylobacterium oryzae CBMB20]
MSATSTLWRSLLTVFLTVMLVALSVAGAGHSHAGATHDGHAMVSAAGHPGPASADQTGDVADHADRGGDKATGHCGLCCCHASFARSDAFAATVAWKPGPALAGIRTVAFDSVVPETLPEPPRTFA